MKSIAAGLRRRSSVALAALLLLGALGCDFTKADLKAEAGSAMGAVVSANPGDIKDMGAAMAAVNNLAGPVVEDLIGGSPPPPAEGEYTGLEGTYNSKKGGAWDIPTGGNLGGRVTPAPAGIPEVPPPPPGQGTR